MMTPSKFPSSPPPSPAQLSFRKYTVWQLQLHDSQLPVESGQPSSKLLLLLGQFIKNHKDYWCRWNTIAFNKIVIDGHRICPASVWCIFIILQYNAIQYTNKYLCENTIYTLLEIFRDWQHLKKRSTYIYLVKRWMDTECCCPKKPGAPDHALLGVDHQKVFRRRCWSVESWWW